MTFEEAKKLACPECRGLSFVACGEVGRTREWHCLNCGASRAHCPECGQGWISRLGRPFADHEVFACGECDATWFGVSEIGTRPAVNFEVWLELQGLLALRLERNTTKCLQCNKTKL
jgi:hypothetical protein